MKKTRLFAMLMAIMMVLGVLHFNVFAEEGTGQDAANMSGEGITEISVINEPEEEKSEVQQEEGIKEGSSSAIQGIIEEVVEVAPVYEVPAFYEIKVSSESASKGTVAYSHKNGTMSAYEASHTTNRTYNDNMKVSAKATYEWKFKEWQENGKKVSSDNPYSFKVKEKRNLIAVFERNQATVINAAPTATVDNKGATLSLNTGGSVFRTTGAGTVVLSHSSKTAKIYYQWCKESEFGSKEMYTVSDKGYKGKGTPYTNPITAAEGKTYLKIVVLDGASGTHYTKRSEVYYLKINRGKPVLKISSSNIMYGTVEGNSGEISSGKNVTVKANPTPAGRFVEWKIKDGEAVSTNPTYSFNIYEDTELVAVFEKKPVGRKVELTFSPPDGGAVAGGGTYYAGNTVTIVAEPNRVRSYQFKEWKVISGDVTIVDNSFEMPDKDVKIEAVFEKVEQKKNTKFSGFTITPQETDESGTFVVTTKVVPENGPEENLLVSGSYSIKCEGNDVQFTEVLHENSTLVKEIHIKASVIGTGNKSLILKYEGNDKYNSSTNGFMAKVKVIEKHTLTLTSNITNAGVLAGEGTYNKNEEVEISATPNAGFTFLGWYEGKKQLSTDSVYKVKIKGNLNLRADFRDDRYTLEVISGTARLADGTTGTSLKVAKGVSVTLTANEPESTKLFDIWVLKSGEQTIAELEGNPATYTMPDKNITVEAKYKDKPNTTIPVLRGIEVSYTGVDKNVGGLYSLQGIISQKMVWQEGTSPEGGIYSILWSELLSQPSESDIGVSSEPAAGKDYYVIAQIQKDSNIKYELTAEKCKLQVNGYSVEVYAIASRESYVEVYFRLNKITSSHTVNFMTGKVIYHTEQISHGSLVEKPEDPFIEAKEFAGWYADEDLKNEFDFANTKITADTMIYAKLIDLYEITYDLNGGTFDEDFTYEPMYMEKGYKDEIPSWDLIEGFILAPEGYIYVGVEIDETKYVPGDKYEVTKDIEIILLWEPENGGNPDDNGGNEGEEPVGSSYITLDLNGGTYEGHVGEIVMYIENGTVIILPLPYKEGHTFDYWQGSRYEAGQEYTVNGDHKLSAQWVENGEEKTDVDPDNTDDNNNTVDPNNNNNNNNSGQNTDNTNTDPAGNNNSNSGTTDNTNNSTTGGEDNGTEDPDNENEENNGSSEEKKENKKNTPKTGDTSSLSTWCISIALTAVVMVIMILMAKKRMGTF